MAAEIMCRLCAAPPVDNRCTAAVCAQIIWYAQIGALHTNHLVHTEGILGKRSIRVAVVTWWSDDASGTHYRLAISVAATGVTAVFSAAMFMVHPASASWRHINLRLVMRPHANYFDGFYIVEYFINETMLVINPP
ncbi:MAG: hypothetical protein PT944_04880 [Actinomycetaceae bacterium]|nr:hypothetical protein [Actinomycetaceae bacterium]MDY5273468.1 hypothetical protein [Arcanobacterium sp.]